jgi:broad specificity phosphatase PhoE
MIYLLRHSERIDQSSDEKEKLSWKKSKRYNQNPLDIPLSSNGYNICHSAIKNILNNYKEDFGFIYSSPLTRCIQTSLEFQKYIELVYSIKILIRIEYGLFPNFFGDTDTLYYFHSETNNHNIKIKFVNNKLKIIKPFTYIDDYLSFDNITKRYGKKHFDYDYLPIYNQDKINSQHNMKPQDICSHRINTFVKLSKLLSKDKLNLIVTHGEIITLFNNWINNEWNIFNSFNLCGGLQLKLTPNNNYKILNKI